MSENSEASNVSRRHFLAVAGSVAAASSFAVGKEGEKDKGSAQVPPAPENYLVTIDVTGKCICYSTSNLPDARNLYVNPGDDIKWIVKSHGPKHHGAIRFRTTTPFNGPKRQGFDWTEKDEGGTTGYGIGTAGPVQGQHEYSVAVVDSDGNLYLDDPKIIVGSGNSAITQLMEARRELAEVKGQIVSIDKELESAIYKLERK